MNVYDANRLTRWGQRRLHAAFEEAGASQTWTVPAFAREIAPDVTPQDWDRGRRNIEAAIQAGEHPLRNRTQLWWHTQWTDPGSQYAVRRLSANEQATADDLLVAMESMRPGGFGGVKGELRDHPDAQAVAESLVIDARLLITKDNDTILPGPINHWIANNAKRWGLEARPVVVDVEDTLIDWGAQHPASLAAVALLAYWPDDLDATDDTVRRQSIACLQSIGQGGTPRLARFTIDAIEQHVYDREWMQTLRENPVVRTRAGEMSHPSKGDNQPNRAFMPGARPVPIRQGELRIPPNGPPRTIAP